MDSKHPDAVNSFLPDSELNPTEVPDGVDRRAFMMRGALVGAVAVLTGCSPASPASRPPRPPPASPPVPEPAALG